MSNSTAIVKWQPQVNRVYCMDALALLGALDDASVDMAFLDLPYGVTACAWDVRIPFEPLWKALRRVMKPRGAMVFTATEPFASMLRMSWLEGYKYDWVWDKRNHSNPWLATSQPLRIHELIVVFGENIDYQPLMGKGAAYKVKRGGISNLYGNLRQSSCNQGTRYPVSIISIPSGHIKYNNVHPTQKPVALLEYLIRTYTRPGELVIDPVCGSGTAGIAARNTNRNCIMGDSSPEYVEVARKRLAEPYTLPMFETLGVAV